jgi:acetoin utilization deacetylase AcuC-like enzyme
MQKYRMLREAVARCLPTVEFAEAPHTTDGVLALAHHPHYIRDVVTGTLTTQAQKSIGFPWSPEMVERSRRSAGATIAACRAAIAEGTAVNLAGGTHHAHADRGEGFCVFNDAAIAARLMQAERRVSRVAIVDLDVHQGNGTAAIFEGDASVFTFSVHGERNYPARKMRSSLDVGLPDGTDDATYLQVLQEQLPNTLQDFVPDLVFYLAGVDVAEGDRYGRFRLTEQGIRERERTILDWARRQGLPLVVTLAGGYSPNALRTAILHCIVFEEAAT